MSFGLLCQTAFGKLAVSNSNHLDVINMSASSTRKFTLGIFIFGVPEFETLFHLLKRLNERGELGLKIILPSSLCRIEPRVPQLLNESQLPYKVLSSKVIKYFYWGCFRGMDAVLGISDPFIDYRRAHKRRNRYLVKLKLPSIYFQHGVIQVGLNRGNTLNWDIKREKTDFYSTKVFLMEYPAHIQQQYFTDSALARIEVSGFIKKPCFSPKPLSSSIDSQLSKYDVRLLICHSLRTSDFTKEEIEHFYSMIEKFAIVNPQIGVIVRPHRGKRRKLYEAHDRKLRKICSNVHFMYHHHGPLKRMSITDALSISDMMISTPSTAILDAVYMGKPVAVCLNYHAIFEGLPQISDARSINKFVIDAIDGQEGSNQLISRYGALDVNIEQTCLNVEKIVTQISA